MHTITQTLCSAREALISIFNLYIPHQEKNKQLAGHKIFPDTARRLSHSHSSLPHLTEALLMCSCLARDFLSQ